jgi:hypothetical protein
MGRDGDLARGNAVTRKPRAFAKTKALGAEGKRAPMVQIAAKPHHVIATEIGTDSRACVKSRPQQCGRHSRGNPRHPDDERHLGL